MSWDHRALDGAEAARFLAAVKERLESGRRADGVAIARPNGAAAPGDGRDPPVAFDHEELVVAARRAQRR